MLLKSLYLENFRNFEQKKINFNLHNLIIGPNGSGKSSILEAIYLLATTNSFRAMKVEEMIKFDQELARIQAVVDSNDNQLEILLTRGMVQKKRTLKKLFAVNQIRRQKKVFLGNFFAVIFRPEDLRLVEGSPSRRRAFLDQAFLMIDTQYLSSLTTYEQALKRRNRLLLKIKDGELNKNVLSYWNLLIVKHGQLIQQRRREFIDFFQAVDFPLKFTMKYLPSVISEEKLSQYQSKEIIVGHTLVGPHKDDFDIKYQAVKNESLMSYGSRGQQRMGVLWLKMAELEFIQSKTHQQPVLLLDDIFSELDDQAQEMVVALLKQGQVVVTMTKLELINLVKKKFRDIKLIKL